LKGYFGFLIVFAAFALLLSLVEFNLNSKSHDLSSAITSEKLYSIQMNVKEVVIEAAREGAKEGFDNYAKDHTIYACADPETVDRCFRVSEARISTESGALLKLLSVLGGANFDDSITVVPPTFDPLSFPVASEIVDDRASPSGYRLSSITLQSISVPIISKSNPSKTLITVHISRIKVGMDEGPIYD